MIDFALKKSIIVFSTFLAFKSLILMYYVLNVSYGKNHKKETNWHAYFKNTCNWKTELSNKTLGNYNKISRELSCES